MDDPGGPPLVRFAAADDLRLFAFGDEAVVFDPRSWDAHLLNPAALAVLELLADAPRTEVEVSAFLLDALESEARSQAADHAKRLIDELHSLGLAVRIERSRSAHR